MDIAAGKGIKSNMLIMEIISERYKSKKRTIDDVPLPKKFYTKSLKSIDMVSYDKLKDMADKNGDNVRIFLAKIVAEYVLNTKRNL